MSHEVDGREYHFVSKEKMEEMLSLGQFIEMIKVKNILYGFTADSIEKIAEQGRICVLNLELEVRFKILVISGCSIVKKGSCCCKVSLLVFTSWVKVQEFGRR